MQHFQKFMEKMIRIFTVCANFDKKRTLFDFVTTPEFNETMETNKVLCVVYGNNNFFFAEINTFC